MDRLDQLLQQFLRERTYINNVTPSTIEWYESAWKAFKNSQTNRACSWLILLILPNT